MYISTGALEVAPTDALGGMSTTTNPHNLPPTLKEQLSNALAITALSVLALATATLFLAAIIFLFLALGWPLVQ